MSEDASAPEVLDRNTIAQIREVSRDINPAFLGEVIAVYLGQAPALIEQMRAAAGQGEHEELAALAHRLKGSSLNLGTVRMAELCGEIERGAKDAAPGALQPLIARLPAAFAAAEKALAELKSEDDA